MKKLSIKKLSIKKLSLRKPHTAPIMSALAIAALVAAGFSSTASATTTTKRLTAESSYKVAIVTDLTGQGAPNGVPALAGFQTAINEINTSGGIDGHKITYNVIDDQSTPSGAATAGQQAVAEHPVAILDGSTSAFLAVREPLYKSTGIPVMATNGTGFGAQPWLYSTSFSPAQAARSLVVAARAALQVKSLKGKRVAVVSIATAGGEAQLTTEKTLLVGQGAVIANTTLNPQGTPSFTAAAANIVSSNPAVVNLLDSAADSIVEAKALIAAGFKGPIVGYFLSADQGTFEAIASPQYVAMRTNGDAVPGTGMYAAAKEFGHTSGTSNLLFGSAWIMTYMLDLGLKKCGSSCATPTALENGINSLGSFNVPGGAAPFGNLLVNRTTHNVTVYLQLFKWNAKSRSVVQYGSPVSVGPDLNSAAS